MMPYKKEKVCILYGWAEGRWHGKKLKQHLIRAGYKIVLDPQHADLIIAHSGGGFLLPNTISTPTIVMIGIPNWPGQHPILRLPKKVIDDFRDSSKGHFFVKTFFNILYVFSKPRHNTKVWLGWRSKKYIRPSGQQQVLALRNQSDAFMNGETSLEQAQQFNWIGLSLLNTSHDDLWEKPEPYVQLINKLG